MKQTILFLLILIPLNSLSQNNFNSSDYKVTRGDLETNTFETDSTANALVIYEYGNSYVDKEDYKLKTDICHYYNLFIQQ